MKMRYACILLSVFSVVITAPARTWTNSEGKSLEAELVQVKDDLVYLRLDKKGKIYPLQISQLSQADQEYIRQYEADRIAREKAEKMAKRRARWHDEYEDAQAEAMEYDLPILLLYTAPEWCGYCVMLEKGILGKDEFEEYANGNLVLLIADFSNPGDADDWKEEYPELIRDFPCSGYPCVYLMNPAGEKLGRIGGYDDEWSVQDYIGKLEKFRK